MPRWVTCWVNRTSAAVANEKATSHRPKPREVHERQQQGRAGDAEPRVDPVGEHDRDDERGGRHGRRQQAEGGRQVGLRAERLRGGQQERVGHREHQDREQDVGDRDEAHERRADDLVEADPQVGDDRPVAAARRRPGPSSSARRPTIEQPDDDRAARPRGRSATPCRSARATGPDSSVPTKLPAIAAPVHSGKRRLAWRASNTDAGHRPCDRHADRARPRRPSASASGTVAG